MAAESYLNNSDIVLRVEEDGAFLFDPDSGRICYVNEVGITIWKQCRKPSTIAGIIARVKECYADVPEEQAEADCRTFLSNLESLGFISVNSKKDGF